MRTHRVLARPGPRALFDIAVAGPDGPVRDLVFAHDRAAVSRLLRGRLAGWDVSSAAIVPLRSVTGVVAHVVLWSPHERRWSLDDEQFLSGLGTQAGQAVTRALAYESMATAANTLQESLLPSRLPVIDDLRLLSAYRAVTAGSAVGGDWFDCIRIADRQVALVIGDVMGKGFRAAAVMGQVRTALRAATAYDPAPGAVLSSLDSGILELEDDEIVTLAYALLDLDTGRLGVARAGHPPPVVARPDGTVEVIEDGGSPPIGWRDAPRDETWTTLQRGSALVLYTDGLVEVRRRSLDEGIAGVERGRRRSPPGLRDRRPGLGRLARHDPGPRRLAGRRRGAHRAVRLTGLASLVSVSALDRPGPSCPRRAHHSATPGRSGTTSRAGSASATPPA